MFESLTTIELAILLLAALAGIAVVITAIRIAIKLAIRIGLVALIVLAALYATGVIF